MFQASAAMAGGASYRLARAFGARALVSAMAWFRFSPTLLLAGLVCCGVGGS